ncbi:MAG: M3 family metallopeptidase [Oceanospirillaceae bacterium]|nr:M3 family metallopeptidase [Oceanospirillaceae bacterium]
MTALCVKDALLLPDFASIDPAGLAARLDKQLSSNLEAIEQLLRSQDNLSYKDLVPALEQLGDEVDRLWGPLSHLHGVGNKEDIRAAFDECLPKLTDYATKLGQNKSLYLAFLGLLDSAEFSQLSQPQQQFVKLQIKDFKLAGVALNPQEQIEYGQLKQQIAKLSTRFSNHLMDATQAWSKHVSDRNDLLGLPESALQQAKESAKAQDLEGYLLKLDFACYHAVMTFAQHSQLRQEIYQAFNTRASDQGPHAEQFDNTPVMEELVGLRHKMACLVGFDHYADYSVATKMADSGRAVEAFLLDLTTACKPQALADMKQLQEFATEQGGPTPLAAWDVAYYSEKLRQKRYDLSQEQLKPYFALPQVQGGLFEVVKRIYGIQVTQVAAHQDISTWHQDVGFYQVTYLGQAIGYFYFDLFARDQKRGGAWMDECRNRQLKANGQLQLPVAYLVCNFAPQVGDTPALLTHAEVTTLFHEFGHGLHHMMTNIDVAGVAGINGVAWDAVELPSQLLENWCWQEESLRLFAKHYQTGAALPEAMLQKMLSAKNFQAGMFVMRQLEFALFDLRLHMNYNPGAPQSVQAVIDQVREEVAVIKAPAWNRFQHGFAHIFAGGYASGYYSYLWAEVLAADVFSRFEEEGIFNPSTGAALWKQITGQGGSEDAMDLFTQFMGRKPSVHALMRHKGLAKETSQGANDEG